MKQKDQPSPPLRARRHYHDNIRADVIAAVESTGGTLIDIGGGVGATAAELKRLGRADRCGVVDALQAPERPSGLDFAYAGDLEDAAFVAGVVASEGPFNTILCLDVLEHLVDPWLLVERLHSGLAPGGTIVASIPNVRNYRVSIPLLFRNRWALADSGILDRTHLRFFVRGTAIDLMTHSGLRLEWVRGLPDQRRRVALLRRLTFGLLDSFTDLQYLICVRSVG